MATIFPLSASVGQIYQGYEFDGTSWNIIGVDLTADYLTEPELETYLNGNISTHMVPNGNEVYDLGTAENKFRDLYLSSGTIYLGDASISASGSSLVVPGYATESYADTVAANIVGAAPETLNTLNELASALGDDANFATTVTNSLSEKASASTVNDHVGATTDVHGVSDMTTLVSGSGITNIIALTQAEYDALTPDPETLYVIV